jgi:monoamine oxidase
VKWSKGSVEIRTRGGAVVRARRAVVTLPLGVLREGSVAFDPPLPGKADAVARLEVGPVVRAVLRFREPFWETAAFPTVPRGQTLEDLSFLHGPTEVFPTWWTQLPMRVPLLVGWSGGPAAERLAGQTDAQVLAAALAALARMLGVSEAYLSERLVVSHAADWQADPFARGAYSYVPVGGLDAMQRLAEPINDALFFAGEATHHEGQSGTVSGAIATGYRAAREISLSVTA